MVNFLKKNIRKDFFYITAIFLVWRLLLIVLMILAINYIPLGYEDRFLGGGPINYKNSPEVFSWANFDGEHYLSISIIGYKGLEQAFFPVYPKLINIISELVNKLLPGFFTTSPNNILLLSTLIGILVTNFCTYVSLILLWELIRLDYPKKIAYLTIILLLTFPTSFYFVSVYSESLFFLLILASFYAARKNKWLIAGLLGAVSSATRVFGLLLLPAYLCDFWKEKVNRKYFFWILLIPVGLFFYMIYQFLTVGDALAFYKLQKIVGEQHQSGLTLLPQVFFRYIKMLSTVDSKNPIYLTIILEFITGFFFFLLPFYGLFKKMRLSYVCFALTSFLAPSIQGSLSSVPRYGIVFFPTFIAFALLINTLPNFLKYLTIVLSMLWLCVETTLFLRGFWVA